MTDLFLDVLNTGIAASWLVLAVIAARLVLKKAPRWLICMLWVIVGVRLVLPATIESPLSLIPSAEVISPESLYDHAPTIHSGVPIIDGAVNPVYTESFRANELASVNPLQVWTAVMANLWVLGMAAMLMWAFLSWLRLKRSLGSAVPDGLDIWVCSSIDTPFILGLFRPRICLPAGLDGPRREHVLAHERAHLQRRDHWWKPLAYLLLTVFWFHPTLWIAYILLCRDIELACDERVIKSMSVSEKKAYSTALLECSIRRNQIAACPLAFGEVGVKARIKSVLNYQKPAFWIIAVGVVVCIAVAVCFLTDPVSYTPEIRYQSGYYFKDGVTQNFLPAEAVPVGQVQTGIVETNKHPTEDFQAVNLPEEYAGADLYYYEARLDLELIRQLYVQCPTGTYQPYTLRTPNALILDLIDEPLDIWVSVSSHTEQLTGDRLIAMEVALDSLRYADFYPGSVTEDSAAPVAIQFDRRGESGNGIELTRYENGQWMLTINDQSYGSGTWLFWEDGLTEDLESQIARYSNLLGIHLSVENVTPTGLTLVCTQDGTLAEQINTGSYYCIERYADGVWEALPEAEGTAWTMEAWDIPNDSTVRWSHNWSWLHGELPPGRYRISKFFSGKLPSLGTITALIDWTDQTCYAEFIIE